MIGSSVKDYFSFTILFLMIIRWGDAQHEKQLKLIDSKATRETKRLFNNLKQVSGNYILFEYQQATEYLHGWLDDSDQSDVKSMTGKCA